MRINLLWRDLEMREWPQGLIYIVIPAVLGVFLGIPVLIAQSDRAAMFAGSLFAASAAVIAVLLTAHFNEKAETRRLDRAECRSQCALSLDLALFMQMNNGELTDLAGSLQNCVDGKPFESNKTVGSWHTDFVRVSRLMPERLASAIGDLPFEVASAAVVWDRSAMQLKERLPDFADKTGPFAPSVAKAAKEMIEMLKERAEIATKLAFAHYMSLKKSS